MLNKRKRQASQKRYRKKYNPRNKKKVSEYNKGYWKVNKMTISKTRKSKSEVVYRSFSGHIQMIFSATKWYIKRHSGKMCSEKSFKDASLQDPFYNDLFSIWEDTGYDDAYSPMVTRVNFTRPYSVENMRWTTKGKIGISNKQKEKQQARKDLIKQVEDALLGRGAPSAEETKKLVDGFKKQKHLWSHKPKKTKWRKG